jgi:hypothetical protein
MHATPWQKVVRDGIAPLLSTAALEALEDALSRNDPRLIQGDTTSPMPEPRLADYPCEAACALGYAGWISDGLQTVGEVEEFFVRMVLAIYARLGGPGFCQPFFAWFDDTPRRTMRKLLVGEVRRVLARRRLASA